MNDAKTALTQEDFDRGFTGQIWERDNVMVVPANPDKKIHRQVYVPATQELLYFKSEPVIGADHTPPQDLGDVKHLKGNHLFGGFVRMHFGHFLLECLSLLWAVDHAEKPVESIVFIPYHMNNDPRNQKRLVAAIRDWMKQLGIETPITVLFEPTMVDHITMGEIGFGFNEKFRGSSLFHNFVRSRMAQPREVTPPPAREKLYLTRSSLGGRKGHIVGEPALERTLSEAGYTIYTPEKDTITQQLERYRNASMIVGVEGSALHLPPFAMPSDTKVAIVTRRSSREKLMSEFGAQFEGFAGVTPVVSDRFLGAFQRPDLPDRLSFECLSVVDFDHIYLTLIEAEMLPVNAALYYPRPEDLLNRLAIAWKDHGTQLSLTKAKA